MKVPVLFAELHSPLFHAKMNLGLKLHDGERGIKLYYDDEAKELLVEAKGRTSNLPSTSMHSYELLDPEVALEFPKPQPNLVSSKAKRANAQVSGPHDHVFQGEGAGKTKDR